MVRLDAPHQADMLKCATHLGSNFYLYRDDDLAAVIHIAVEVIVSAVAEVLFASGAAGSDVGRYSFLVRAALVFALLGYSTLRMCHR